MEHITIKNLKVFGFHGVCEEEKKCGQDFIINIDIDLVKNQSYQTDDILDTVHYGEVCYFVRDYFKKNQFSLLEKLVYELSDAILEAFPGIWKITLEVDKPDAPIEMEFDYVGVSITKQWTTCYLSLGSNMGDKEKYLKDAVAAMRENPHIRNMRVSDMIETQPYGYTAQDTFMNMAVAIDTTYFPYELLDFAHSLEKSADRKRLIHWGPRTLDVDIVLFGQMVLEDKNLTIPHIDMSNRRFVLEPICQINPGAVHPLLHKTMKQLLEELHD